MTSMKSFLPTLFLGVLLTGTAAAQDKNLAESYYHFTLAKMHSLDKQYADANVHYQKAIELNPNSAELHVQYALSLWESQNIREAVLQCQKAIEMDADDPAPHYLLGRIYVAFKESSQPNMLDKALAEFERVIELDKNHAAALDALGRLYVAKENWAKASQVFGQLNRVNPGYSNAYYLRGVAELRLGNPQEAMKVLEAAVQAQAAEIDHLKLLGSLYLQFRMPAKAAETLRLASETDPRDPQIKLELAKALRQTKKYPEAMEILGELVKGETDAEFDATVEMAQIQAVTGRRQEAIENFRKALEMKESEEFRPLILGNLGLVYQDSGQHEKAIESYRQAVDLQPESVENRLRLVYALKEAGKTQEAVDQAGEMMRAKGDQDDVIIAYSQVLAANGQLEKGVAVLTENATKKSDAERFALAASQIYIEHKKYDEAEKAIRRALEQKPDSLNLLFQLGAVLERQEEYTDAETNFKKVLEKEPGHAGVLNYLGYMLADRGIRLEEALGYIKKAVEIEPYNGAYLDSLGWAYFKLNQFEPAELHLKQAAQIVVDDATIFEHLGDLYRKLERYGEAGAYYEKSVSNAKETDERKRVQSKLNGVKKLLAQQRQ